MAQPTSDQRQLLRKAIDWFSQVYLPNRYSFVYQRLPIVGQLEVMGRLYAETRQLLDLFIQWPVNQLMEIPEDLIPCLKLALVIYRRSEGSSIDKLKARTNNPDLLQELEKTIVSLDVLLQEPWFAAVSPMKMPRIADLLSIQDIESSRHASAPLLDREYDENFHILQAPKLFLEDLNHYRRQCEERGTPVVAAYIDIDDFKAKFNSPYGETQIDRRVLTIFMQALEGHVFHHGFAYRQHGDEYLLVLPNLSRDLAINFLDALRLKLSKLEYRDIVEKTTVSIGFCCVDPDSHLTDREIEELANNAKNFAKDHGKNRIATYKGTSFETSELHVVSP